MNFCMSITRALLLYFIECNCNEFFMSITRALMLYFIEYNCDGFLYAYYEGSIVVLY
jgi:hypothetical protein